MEQLQQLYDDFTAECHKVATEKNKSHLNHMHIYHIAKRVGVRYNAAKMWMNGEVL